ncbi:PREDICTED: carabin [Cyprinodon variegatus]|uniref:TBC1 domain family, member 10C n=1 Tax=Cyprinodon variegatus TaxID=28743 RepID=A0A3Q2EGE0_CYPVA|nr:PREDICTED: carabin [Cyprinodon variegatus]
MLKASSQAQKHLSEEDSSGSDAGSEVSLEPETDRFGFILTNGSTAGTMGPSPELVRQREAKWINIMSQWDRILIKKSNKVKLQCQKGIPASLRAKCWPLLCGATDRMRQNKGLYESLDSQPGLQSWVDIIERDLDRQFPFHEMFLSKDGHGQRGLFRVLKAYTQFQPEEGYCQAQGPVAAVLLMNMPAEEAFWCLVQISEQYLPGYYSPLLEGVLFDAAILSWVLKKTCPAAHKHLQQHGVEPLMFATDWLMCLFTRHLPFNTLLRVWDLFFCYGVRVLLQVAVVLVRRVLGRAEQRKQCPGQMETLERLRGVREHVQEEEESFIAEVCSVPLSGKDLERRTEKELDRWRKDKPTSTFDPRGRCYGYRMAWARARQREEEREKKERQTGNLSIPLARSASTLSLSPSLLHKRFRKGGKVNASEWESGKKVVRHLSMGAKEDWKSWSDLEFKKVQGVQEEDLASDGQKTENEAKLTEDQQEENKNSPTEQREETMKEEKKAEPLEEKENSKEKGEIIIILENTEDCQSVENKSQTAEESSQCEEMVDPNQTQPLEEDDEQSHEEETGDREMNQKVENEEKLQNTELSSVQEEPENKNNEDSEDPEIINETENPGKLQNTQQSHVLEEPVNSRHEEESTDLEINQIENPEKLEHKEKSAVLEESGNSKHEEESADLEIDLIEMPEKLENIEKSAVLEEPGNSTHEEESADLEIDLIENPEKLENIEKSAVLEEPGNSTHEEESTDVQINLIENPGKLENTEKSAVLEEPGNKNNEYNGDPGISNATENPGMLQNTVQSHVLEEPSNEQEKETTEMHEEEENPTANSRNKEELEEHPTETQSENINTKTETQLQILTESWEEPATQADMKPEAATETENSQLPQRDAVTERSETNLDSESHQDLDPKTDTQQQEEEGTITEHSSESLVETEKAEAHTHLDTQTDVLAENTALQDELNEETTQTEGESQTPPESPKGEEENEISISVKEVEAVINGQIEEAAVSGHAETQGEECVSEQRNSEESEIHVQTDEEAVESSSPAEKEILLQDESLDQKDKSDQKQISTSDIATPEQSAPEAVKDAGSIENVQESKAGEDDVFVFPEPKQSDSNTEIHQETKDPPELSDSSQELGFVRHSSRSSGDFRLRKSSVSRSSTRRLSEDLFSGAEKAKQSHFSTTQPESQPEESKSEQTVPQVADDAAAQQAETPKRFGLFRKLKGEQPEKAKQKKKKAKMQVPKILIQDFSDVTPAAEPAQEDTEEKLSSRERRRRRREQDRKEKEEEKLKKKKEKEKDRERRKPQTRGKSFQAQKEKVCEDVAHPAKAGSQIHRHSVSYAESYF